MTGKTIVRWRGRDTAFGRLGVEFNVKNAYVMRMRHIRTERRDMVGPALEPGRQTTPQRR